MGKVLIHPELIDLYTTWLLADADYEDNRGSSDPRFADDAREARDTFRKRKAELEAEGATIFSES